MSKERTDASVYKSEYGAGYVTPAQYFCELVVARKYKYEMGRIPPQKFWSDKKWGKEFARQSKAANELLSKFSHESIAKALRDKRCKDIFSLGFKSKLEPVIREFEEKKTLVSKQTPTELGAVDKAPKPFSPSNKISKLNEL